MKPFTFLQPSTVAEAVGLLAKYGPPARPLAGGQSLLLELKERTACPAVLVSLAGVAELVGWHYTESGELEVGPTTSYAALLGAELRGWHREIAAVAGNLADRPVRTMGTIGGALCQADPRFDIPTLVVGVDASVVTVSTTGSRRRPAAELFGTAGGSALEPAELLTGISFPAESKWSAVAFEKYRIRIFDAALVSVVCALSVGTSGQVTGARLTVGAVAPGPLTAPEAAGLLVGRTAGDATADVGQALTDDVLPAAHAVTQLRRYQRELIPVLARRAIARAFEQSGS